MGIGRKANIESSIAIELLEKLMEINMNKNIIIRQLILFLGLNQMMKSLQHWI